MKEKILIVHNYYQIPGGEDTVVDNETRLLREHGHQVFHYTRDNKELKGMGKLRKLLLPFSTIYNPKTYRDVVRMIKDNDIDIVHVHNTLNLISPAVYYAARKCKVPVFQTIHNFRLVCPGATLYRDGHICEECIRDGVGCSLRHKCYRNSMMQTLCCALLLKIHRWFKIYRKINYICLTDFNKEKLLEINKYSRKQIFDPARVFVKPNFMPKKACNSVDNNGSVGAGNDIDQDGFDGIIPASGRKKQFIFAGRLDETKGIDTLLEAWKIFVQNLDSSKSRVDSSEGFLTNNSEYELVICGTGPMEEWCHNYVTDNGLVESVKLLGKTDHDRVVDLMSESMAMILPTRWYEGFPMSIAESYSVGTMVVGPGMGNVGNLIVNEITGFKYVANDVNELVRVIRKITELDNDTLEKICSNAYKEYLYKYTDELNYQKMIEIYENCNSIYLLQ